MLDRPLLSQNCPQGQLDLPHTGNPTDVQAGLWVQVLWDSSKVERSSQQRVRMMVVPAVAGQNSDSQPPLLIFGLGICIHVC